MQRFRRLDHATWVLFTAFLSAPLDAQGVLAEEVVDLLLVAGQSNAVGYDAKPMDLPADPGDEAVLFWFQTGDPPPDDHDSSSGGQWTTLRPQPLGQPKQPREGRQYGNFAQPEGGFGPEMGLTRALRREQPGRPLAVIKVAFSGTGLATDWHPDDPGDVGACYRALVANTRIACQALKTLGKTIRPRALVWVQGESDANPIDAPKYQDRLGHLLRSLKRDLEWPELPAFLSLNARFGDGSNPHVAHVIAAQKALDADDPWTIHVDTAEVDTVNAAHWSSAGTLDAGRRFAKALLDWESMMRK
jgi:hypothetical protein